MCENEMLDDKIVEMFQDCFYRLSNFKQVLTLYFHCLENQEYANSEAEFYCLGYILQEYFEQTVDNFVEIEKMLGIYE